jgi:hypothetical protein
MRYSKVRLFNVVLGVDVSDGGADGLGGRDVGVAASRILNLQLRDATAVERDGIFGVAFDGCLIVRDRPRERPEFELHQTTLSSVLSSFG